MTGWGPGVTSSRPSCPGSPVPSIRDRPSRSLPGASDTDRQHSTDARVLQYIPLVKYVARRTPVRLTAVTAYEDLIGFGVIGLIQALSRFDETVGVKFETYAIRRIRGAMLDAVRALDGMPRSVRNRSRDAAQATQRLTAAFGRVPTSREVAAELRIGLGRYHQSLATADVRVVSLEIDGDDRPTDWRDQLPDPAAEVPSDAIEQREMRMALARAIAALPEREQRILALYYPAALPMREVARALSLSPSRVSQLHAGALATLRGNLRPYA